MKRQIIDRAFYNLRCKHLRQHAKRVFLVLTVSVLSGCDIPQNEFSRMEGATMGTYYGITYQGCALSQPSVEGLLASINSAVSTYDPQSEISQFNAGAADLAVLPSRHFATPLRAAGEVWRQSGGAFDPTVGPLVDLWGFGPELGAQAPSAEQQTAVARVLGWQKLTLSERDQKTLLVKKVAGVELDLSAIAKGYAVDQLADFVRKSGCQNYMVDIGGEMAVAGVNADGELWRLGVERPDPEALGSIQLVLAMTDVGIATSGDYRNYRVVNGQRVDHVMDPRSGEPADNQVVSATVVHPSAMYADGYATAAMVLDVAEALTLANEQNFALLIMTRAADDAGAELHYNGRMEQYMVSTP